MTSRTHGLDVELLSSLVSLRMVVFVPTAFTNEKHVSAIETREIVGVWNQSLFN